jgi:hypothetical protein
VDNDFCLPSLDLEGTFVLVVNHSSHLWEQRHQFQKTIGGSDYVSVFRDKFSPHTDIALCIYDLKYDALDLRDKIDHSVSSAADKLGEIGK